MRAGGLCRLPVGSERMEASSSELPTGTVTFLFSDIEDSTRLAEELATSDYRDLIEEHHRVLRRVFADTGGSERGTEGDGFLVVFRDGASAVKAAVEVQRSLIEAAWPEGREVRVRIGLHSGRGIPGGDDYVGSDVNRAARVAAAAHGGQILISDSTRALSERSLPDDVAIRYVGEYRLKGLDSPERLYQLVISGLSNEFPPPRTADVDAAHVPRRLTPFIGRRSELSQLLALLQSHRLITLVGPGGAGKTSLAIELAREAAAEFSDGAWFVDLSGLSDPTLAESAIATSLGLGEKRNQPASEVLVDHLVSRQLLLVLDNFEHLLAASDSIANLLAAAPSLNVVITSRSRVNLYGEQTFPVPPLALPDPDSEDLAEIAKAEAVSLFIERARTVKPDFSPTSENVSLISRICAHVDGLPLAIELAASRMRLLTLGELLERLERQMPVLTASETNRPERQQTLQRTIQWSYELMSDVDKDLFIRLSIFSGGFTVQAAETVCNPDGELGIETLDGLASLEDQSLIRQRPVKGSSRFEMLETIRSFGHDLLMSDGPFDEISVRHLHYYLTLAECAEPHLMKQGRTEWLERLEAEHANLRGALHTAVESSEAESGLRLASSLWRFWFERGHLREGRRWLEDLLALDQHSVSIERAKANTALGGLAYWMSDAETTEKAYEAALAIYQQMGDDEAIARALYDYAFAAAMGNDPQETRKRFNASMSAAERVGSESLIAQNQIWFGLEALMRNDPQAAASLLEEALEIFRKIDDRLYISWAVGTLSQAYIDLGRLEDANAAFLESINLSAELRNSPVISSALTAFAHRLATMDRHYEAATLTGAASAIEADTEAGSPLLTVDSADLDATRAALGEETFSKATAEGSAMTAEEAFNYAKGFLEES